jgi:predicted nucleic-acid-binding Zn-ribbon protein
MSETQPTSGVFVANKPLTCTHCGNTSFHQTNIRLNHRWTSFFDVEWMGKWGVGYICTSCGLKQEFYNAQKFGRGYHKIGLWIVGVFVLGYLILAILSAWQ